MPELIAGVTAPTVGEVGAPPPAPPKLRRPERRFVRDRWQHVVPEVLERQLGDRVARQAAVRLSR